jgi:DNA-binding CsgD family transcriptional regulator
MRRRGRPPYPGLLTPREQEVLDSLRAGLTNPAIGDRLGISVETVKQHVSQILSKLDVTTREEAVAWQPRLEPARQLSLGRVLLAVGGTTIAVGAIVGLGVLTWGLTRSGDGDSSTTTSPTASVSNLKPADSQSPAAGICARDPGNGQARIQFNVDVPAPRCQLVIATTYLHLVNNTEASVDFELGSFSGSLPPAGDAVSPLPAGQFLAPGVHVIRSTAYGGGSGTLVGSGEVWLSTPSQSTTPSPAPLSYFPAEFVHFGQQLDQALAAHDTAFFTDNTSFGQWECASGSPPPGPGPNCIPSTTTGGSGIVLGLWNSEGDVLSPATYNDYIAALFSQVKIGTTDAFGNAQPRVLAIADVSDNIEGDNTANTYEFVVTGISSDPNANVGPALVPPGADPSRIALVFFASPSGSAWKIIRIDRATRTLIDPYSESGVRDGMNQLLKAWLSWADVP